jgi:acyl dehydratase
MTTHLTAPSDLLALVGRSLGTTNWHEITQQQVNLFADATGDHQWLHVDPDRAKAGPFSGPIAHDHLTLSLTPLFLAETINIEQLTAPLNYGLNPGAVPGAAPDRKEGPRARDPCCSPRTPAVY